MPKFEFHFDLAAILLASVLTVLGISSANAGGALGGVVNTKASHDATGSVATGGKDGVQGGDVRSSQFGGISGGVIGSQN